MEKKILFVDLDGTLLDDNKNITPENLAAIQKATEAGHAVVVTTGRPLYSTIFQLEKLHMDKPGCYAITSNGALIYDAHTKKIIFQTGVDKNCIREAFDEAYKFGLHPQTYSDHGVLCEREDPEIQYYAKSTMVNYEVLDDVTKVITRDPIKMLFIDLPALLYGFSLQRPFRNPIFLPARELRLLPLQVPHTVPGCRPCVP